MCTTQNYFPRISWLDEHSYLQPEQTKEVRMRLNRNMGGSWLIAFLFKFLPLDRPKENIFQHKTDGNLLSSIIPKQNHEELTTKCFIEFLTETNKIERIRRIFLNKFKSTEKLIFHSTWRNQARFLFHIRNYWSTSICQRIFRKNIFNLHFRDFNLLKSGGFKTSNS